MPTFADKCATLVGLISWNYSCQQNASKSCCQLFWHKLVMHKILDCSGMAAFLTFLIAEFKGLSRCDCWP